MPAPGHASHWKKPNGETPLLFARGSMVVTPSGRKATLTQYWTSPTHEYAGCASIKYVDNNETAIISLSLLKQWKPGVTYTAPPLIKINPIPAPAVEPLRIGGHVICTMCPFVRPKVKRARVPDCQLSFPFIEAAA